MFLDKHINIGPMEMNLFAYDDYKTYLRERIRAAPRAGHGLRQRMAQAMGIQPTYLSQVLKGDRDLNIDQTVLLAEFLRLNREETEFLLLLVQARRTGFAKTRQFFSRLINERQEAFLRVKNRVKINNDLSDQDKTVYYSDILYGAVHMAVTIPGLRTIERLAERFSQPKERIHDIVTFLLEKDLIARQSEQLAPASTLLFVDKSSPHVISHHRNWRLKAMERASARKADDYQISLGVSLSESDARLVRQRLAKLIEEIAQQVKDSPAEKLMGFCLDFFEY